MRAISLALLALAVGLTGACMCRGKTGGSPAPVVSADPGPARRGGVLTMGTGWTAYNFEPVSIRSSEDVWVTQLLYEQLLRVRDDGLGAEPGLAESWDISPDGLVYTFHLRPDLVFADGEPLRSSDVKFSLLRATQDTSLPCAIYYPPFEIQTPDDRTVVLKLEAPSPALLALLALITASILPEAHFNQVGGDRFNKAPIGSGPFVLAEHRNGSHTILKRNPRYRDPERPHLDEVRLVPIWDSLTRMLKLQAGELDVADNVPFSQVELMAAMPGVKMHTAPIMISDLLFLNPRTQVFQDIKVRQAIHFAIDRAALVRLVYFGHAEVATSFLPRLLYTDPVPYRQDLRRARQLLAESDHPDGLSATMLVQSGGGDEDQVALVLQSQLAPLGIHLDIQRLDGALRWSRLQRGDYEAALNLGWTSEIFDPLQVVEELAVSKNEAPRMWGYRNAAVDELAARAKLELDPARRAAMYLEIQRMVTDDAVVIGLARPLRRTALRDNVHGFAVAATANYLLQEVWKSP